MTNFYQPDLSLNPENPFARDGDGKLVRRGYWLDMGDRSIVMALSQGIGANLTNDQKKLHLSDIGRPDLIDQICIVEVLGPDE
tara:strand:- start:183 stop:431 length:249 start_codon:yes stop_codon:yes gene_type:complete